MLDRAKYYNFFLRGCLVGAICCTRMLSYYIKNLIQQIPRSENSEKNTIYGIGG